MLILTKINMNESQNIASIFIVLFILFIECLLGIYVIFMINIHPNIIIINLFIYLDIYSL